MAMLEVKDINVYYGLIHALRDVSFEVNEGEVVALIGANGAGKTTIMHSVCNLIPKAGGKVTFEGNDITAIPAHKLVPMGISQVPEGRRIFQELTVAENLKMGAYTRRDKKENEETLERMYKRFPILKDRAKQIAGTLSGGEQQMLAVGRALMSRPKLLMLDEPSLGLAPLIIKDIFTIIQQIKDAGVNVLLIEQNAKAALEISDYAYVMETGNITMAGPGKALMNDERVKAAYLGE